MVDEASGIEWPTPVSQLRGPRLLKRTDGRPWSSALEPVIRDTATLPPEVDLGLGQLDWLITAALSELMRHPLPKYVIHLGPDELSNLDEVAFASFAIGHRAERLVQCVELSAGALDNLERGSLQLAAVAARALFEIAATSWDVHSTLTAIWPNIHGRPDAIVAIVREADSDLWQALWKARVGTRRSSLMEQNWPAATNVMTRLGRFGAQDVAFAETVTQVYEWLCDATHPNVESQAVLWRRGGRDSHGRQLVEFDPVASQSPVKLAILDAVCISYKVIIQYCRDLWWIAAETACASSATRDVDPGLGIPRPRSDKDPCCCGSGITATACDHPEPELLSAEWSSSRSGRPAVRALFHQRGSAPGSVCPSHKTAA
jgi:hypothetical protein